MDNNLPYRKRRWEIDDLDQFKSWIGRTETVADTLDPWRARAAAAMLDRDHLDTGPGDALPPLWHWFYFLGTASQACLSEDGHPERGGFMPPIELPRRMFAGARMRFHGPLSLGLPAERHAEIRNIKLKTGRTGRLAFVTVAYRFVQDGKTCIEEEQDIVYREPGDPVPAPKPVAVPEPEPGTWQRTIQPDPRLLFRFSALTFNAHRIHYDRAYALDQEGYPGLVVHGPLNAMLLADLVHRNDKRPIVAFTFRGVAPLFDLAPFRLLGHRDDTCVTLDVRGPDDRTVLMAEAELGRDKPEEN